MLNDDYTRWTRQFTDSRPISPSEMAQMHIEKDRLTDSQIMNMTVKEFEGLNLRQRTCLLRKNPERYCELTAAEREKAETENFYSRRRG